MLEEIDRRVKWQREIVVNIRFRSDFTYIRHWTKQSIAVHYTRIFECEWSKYGHTLTILFIWSYSETFRYTHIHIHTRTQWLIHWPRHRVVKCECNTRTRDISARQPPYAWVCVSFSMSVYVCMCVVAPEVASNRSSDSGWQSYACVYWWTVHEIVST